MSRRNAAEPKTRQRASTRRVAPESDGATRAAQNGVERPSLPHEHDESHEGQDREVGKDPVERSAASDVRNHQVDTDRGPAPDETYRRLKG
jgi:hypothetical protein